MDDLERKLISDWDKILDDVEKTQYPIEFVNSVTISYASDSINSGKFQQIDFKSLRGIGYNESMLSEILDETLESFPDDDGIMEFKLDIKNIAIAAQLETESYLMEI